VITTTITAGWAVALVVVLIVRDSLPSGERWWLWTCVTGVVLGFFGMWYVPHLQRRRAAVSARRTAHGQDSPENDSNTVSSSETPGMSTRS
jgi:H+/Cl- antiporter ClcA